jgi:hypothetical protein
MLAIRPTMANRGGLSEGVPCRRPATERLSSGQKILRAHRRLFVALLTAKL